MFCSKCGKELEKGAKFCDKCGNKVEENKEDNKKKNKKLNLSSIFLMIIVLICIIAGICLFIRYSNDKKNNEANMNENNDKTTENIQESNSSIVSFSNMKSDDKNLSDIQREILKYFDDNYFTYDGAQAQKYPEVFKNSKITSNIVVVKVLKSTDDEFEILAVQGGGTGYSYDTQNTTVIDYGLSKTSIDKLKQENLMIIRGKQLQERLVKGDVATIYGRYNNIETKEIDGKSYTIPSIDLINVMQLGKDGEELKDVYRFNLSTIKTVAKYIFGKDIKINEPTVKEDYGSALEKSFDPYYKVTLDNQSNANFKVFNMYKNYGAITYNIKLNGLSNNIEKRIFVSADFQHYIISTYDADLKYVYIDYFDKSFTKLWSREFKYNSNKEYSISPMDYNNDTMAFVIDNDLYIVDLKTGNDIIEPVIVGEKNAINMLEDGILLIGTDCKDAIMKVDFNGKTVFKQNISSDIKLIGSSEIQMVNDNIAICLWGEIDNDTTGLAKKYIVIDCNGKIKISTKDIDAGF